MLATLMALQRVETWGFGEWIIAIIVIGSILGIAFLVLQYNEITVPPIILRIFMIVLIAAVAIVAVRFLLSL